MDKKQAAGMGLLKNKQVVDFLKMLVRKKNYKNISPAVEEQITRDLAGRLDTFIAARVISALSDTDVLTFEKMLEERKSEREIQQFVTAHIDNFNAFLTAVLLEFKDVYLGKFPKPVVLGENNQETKSTEPVLPPAPIDTRVN